MREQHGTLPNRTWRQNPLLTYAPTRSTQAAPDASARYHQTVVCLSKLPPFHAAALKLLNISSESETAVHDFETAFAGDPALTADLLLVANSARFGSRNRVSTIHHAVSYLGLELVRSLAATVAVSALVRGIPRSDYLREVWEHSVATAVIADMLGNLTGSPGLYTTGLTHDLGRLGLFVTGTASCETESARGYDTIDEANWHEIEVFGMNHCEAGSWLGEQWGFPADLLTAMAEHHRPLTGEEPRSHSTVSLACRFAEAIGFPEIRWHQPPTMPELPVALRNRPQLAVKHLQEQVAAQLAVIAV
jgi:HD-like signal output (HDOD) protein